MSSSSTAGILQRLYHCYRNSRAILASRCEAKLEHFKVEQIHGRSLRGVKQELYLHFVLLTIVRSFGNRIDYIRHLAETDSGPQTPRMRANFKNVIKAMARNFEALALGHCQQMADAVGEILDSIGNCLQRERPAATIRTIPCGRTTDFKMSAEQSNKTEHQETRRAPEKFAKIPDY